MLIPIMLIHQNCFHICSHVVLNLKLIIMESREFIDNVVTALKRAAVEIEEFQLQATLGKAEANDKYEELKKKFNLFVHESKATIKAGQEKMDDINTIIDELRVQLALGKADSTEIFKEQKKKLLLILHELEVKIKGNETLQTAYAFLMIEIDKFKVQLQVLEKKLDGGKEETERPFEKGKQGFNGFVDGFKEKFTMKKEKRWSNFQDEISEAFENLKHSYTK